jgi:UDP-N-acetylmuramoyl-tripeptide--D-alanyl-D-alanine ligase
MRSEAGPYTVNDILESTSGILLQGRADTAFDGICTDTRELAPNDLFVPLTGQNFNGNSFVIPALDAGAGGSLVNCDVQLEIPYHLSDHVLIQVQDTLRSLTDLASTHRKIYPTPLIAITGSSGKTTVKEMIGSVLRKHGPVRITVGNLNNLIGLPMTVLDIRRDHKIAVVEAGINRVGEMDLLAKAASPNVAVITNIGQAHLEGLGSVENIAIEKFKLVQGLAPGGLGIVPEDSEALRKLMERFSGRIVTFGRSRGDFKADNIKLGVETSFEIVGPFGRTKIQWNLLGLHNILNSLAACAACLELKIPIEDIREGLQNFRPPALRMEVKELRDSRKLIRDFYNANPLSMKAALEALTNYREKRSAIAILGDMMELGDHAPELHEEIGAFAGKAFIDRIVYIGAFRDDFARGFLSSGGDDSTLRLFSDKKMAWEFLRGSISDFQLILVKGSRAMKMELIADQIEREI